MDVRLIKRGCTHVVHSDEQLNRFLKAGWEVEKPPVKEPAEEKAPVKKSSKTSKVK